MLKIDVISNKRYMQTPEFWEDPHNKKMSELMKKLAAQRRILTYIAEVSPNDFFHRTDGFIEPKKKTGFFKFLKGPYAAEKMFAKDMNEEYKSIKSKMALYSNQARQEIKK